jgi:hypothetical protein
MGARGPAPKRSSERRRRNKESKPTKGKSGSKKPPKAPKADPAWHVVAKQWYESLAKSGQSEFYEESDWAMAYLVAESISRDLSEQFVGINERTGEPVREFIPMKGASLSAYLKAMSALMVSEADRRRAGIELERAGQKPGEEEEQPGVTALADYRKRVGA